MEYVLIPMHKDLIAFVEFGLEENEPEEFYHLKKVQEKRKVIQQLIEQPRLERCAGGNKEGRGGEPAPRGLVN
jgi:hypothetical protein